MSKNSSSRGKHRYKRLMVSLATLAFALTTAPADAQRANTVGVLVEKCLKLPLLTNPSTQSQLTTHDIVRTASCANFFDGAKLMHDRLSTDTGSRLWCNLNSETPIAEMVTTFIEWASNHTHQLDAPGIDGIVDALSTAYPCDQA